MQLIPIPAVDLPDIASALLETPIKDLIEANQAFYLAVGFDPPWIAYLALEDDRVTGTCAFKGAPANGSVELAYNTRSGMEGRGLATRMVIKLIHLARHTDPAIRIIAQTLPVLNASSRVLIKCGFVHVRNAMDDEVGKVWEWELNGTV